MHKSDMQAHVERLASEQGVEINYQRFARPRAEVVERRIIVRPVQSLVTYYTALHELGHVVTDKGQALVWVSKVISAYLEHGTPIPIPPLVEREYEAWEWALDLALAPPSPQVWQLIHLSLTSHIAAALGRQKVGGPKLVPDAGHPVYALMDRAARHT